MTKATILALFVTAGCMSDDKAPTATDAEPAPADSAVPDSRLSAPVGDSVMHPSCGPTPVFPGYSVANEPGRIIIPKEQWDTLNVWVFATIDWQRCVTTMASAQNDTVTE